MARTPCCVQGRDLERPGWVEQARAQRIQNGSSRIVITPAAPQISVFRNIRRICLLSLSSVRPTASQMRPPGKRKSFVMGYYRLGLRAALANQLPCFHVLRDQVAPIAL